MGNERLRTAMAKARVDIEAVTNKTGVDPKTVQRWLDGLGIDAGLATDGFDVHAGLRHRGT